MLSTCLMPLAVFESKRTRRTSFSVRSIDTDKKKGSVISEGSVVDSIRCITVVAFFIASELSVLLHVHQSTHLLSVATSTRLLQDRR